MLKLELITQLSASNDEKRCFQKIFIMFMKIKISQIALFRVFGEFVIYHNKCYHFSDILVGMKHWSGIQVYRV